MVLSDCLIESSVLSLEAMDNPNPKSSESIQLLKPELDSCMELTVKVPATKAHKSKQGEEVRWTPTHREPLCCFLGQWLRSSEGDLPHHQVLAPACGSCFGLQPIVPSLLPQILRTGAGHRTRLMWY